MKQLKAKTESKVPAAAVGRDLRRAPQAAGKPARACGTPVCVEQDGNSGALKP